MDADDDGIACEELETGAAGDETAATAQYDQYVAQGAAPAASAPVAELPDTGGPSLPLVAGALLLSTGVLGLFLLKRTS